MFKVTTSNHHTRNHSLAYVLFVLTAVIIRLAMSYYPFVKFGYLVPPGGDPANHAALIDMVMRGEYSSEYPWLFHYLCAFIAKIFNISSMQSLLTIVPSLVVLPALGVLFFLNKLFGRRTAFVGLVIALFASDYGVKALGDGNYPNIIAAGFLIPVFLTFFINVLVHHKIKNIIWLVIVLAAIIFTHHLSVVYLFISLLFFLPAYYFWLGGGGANKNRWKPILVILVLLGVGMSILYFSPLGATFQRALTNFGNTGSFLSVDSFNKPLRLSEYGSNIGFLTFFGGTLALLYLIAMLDRAELKKEQKLSIVLIFGWFVGLFVCSSTSLVGIPIRFARELGMPLAIAISIVVSDIYSNVNSVRLRATALVAIGLIIYLNLTHINSPIFTSPDYFEKMVWIKDDDLSKMEAINQYVKDDEVILTNENNPYLDYYVKGKIISNTVLIGGEDQFEQRILKQRVRYVFISREFNTNYRNYLGEDYKLNNSKIADNLDKFIQDDQLLLEFRDGSKLVCVQCDE